MKYPGSHLAGFLAESNSQRQTAEGGEEGMGAEVEQYRGFFREMEKHKR